MSIDHSIAIEAAKSAPAVTVAASVIAGFSVNEWAAIVTIVYVFIQAALILEKRIREGAPKRKREEDDAE